MFASITCSYTAWRHFLILAFQFHVGLQVAVNLVGFHKVVRHGQFAAFYAFFQQFESLCHQGLVVYRHGSSQLLKFVETGMQGGFCFQAYFVRLQTCADRLCLCHSHLSAVGKQRDGASYEETVLFAAFSRVPAVTDFQFR